MKLSDLPQFSPQELTVKILDGVITVWGTHTEVDSGSGVSKSHTYLRRFTGGWKDNDKNAIFFLIPCILFLSS